MAVHCALPAQDAHAQAPLAASAMPSGSGAGLPDSATAAYRPAARAAATAYLIGAGDLLAISVWKDTELSKTMPVRPDGRISLPLIGEVQAAGLTADQLQEAILQRLASYMSNPQVNVIVQEIRSRSFNIVGKVNKPGAYDLAKPVTVLDAVAMAGGFQEFARVSKIYVLRHDADGTTRMLPFNYKQVIKGHSLDQNVQLHPGDTVVAP
jgi:polysaccharide export outer membrane protein